MKIIERLLKLEVDGDPETAKMISRSPSRRLERLETSIMPTSTTGKPVAIILQFFSPEKVVTSSMSIEVDLPRRTIPEKAE